LPADALSVRLRAARQLAELLNLHNIRDRVWSIQVGLPAPVIPAPPVARVSLAADC
jgi:hypothetical protein